MSRHFFIGVLKHTRIPQLLLCMAYLLGYGDIESGSHFEK